MKPVVGAVAVIGVTLAAVGCSGEPRVTAVPPSPTVQFTPPDLRVVTPAPAPAPSDTQPARTPPPRSSSPAPRRTAASAKPAPPNRASGRPGVGNTGVPAGTVLKVHYGDVNVTTPGAVLDAMDIHGYVKISAPNVRITRSIIRGGAGATQTTGLVTSYNPANTGLVIEDSELRPKNPTYWIEGAKVQNATFRRVEITGTVDGIGVHGDNVRVENSWIHGLRHYTPFPGQSDNQTHNDGIQVHLGKGLRVVNSTITGAHNAAVMVTPNTGVVGDLQLVGNWMDNGGCTVNISEKGRGAISGLVINDNKFGRNTRVADCAVIMPLATGAVAVTLRNVWEDNGTAVRIRKNGA